MADLRWLEQRAQGWYCVKDVPRALRKRLGRKRLIKSLKTRDLGVAQAARHRVLAEFQRQIDRAKSSEGASNIVERGLHWRQTLEAIERGDSPLIGQWWGSYDAMAAAIDGDKLTPQEDARACAKDALAEECEAVEHRHGRREAELMFDVAMARATPLLAFVEQWLAEGGPKGPLRERTKAQYHSDLNSLAEWAQKAGVAPLIESFDRKTAGRYITEHLLLAGTRRTTVNRRLSASSAYWRWLIKRGHALTNPWREQSLSKSGSHSPDTEPRPFTDAELATLLAGSPDAELSDAIRVAALSGMRIEEIYRLTVTDALHGWFRVRATKTKAGRRNVPVHSALAPIIERRTVGKAPDAHLFPEPGPARPGRERSMAASKRFATYRRSVGVDDRPDNQRQSRVNFHSFRRWFVTEARRSNDKAVVAAVVGHKTGNLTDDIYSGGPDDAARQRCVESSAAAVRQLDRRWPRPGGRPVAAGRVIQGRFSFIDDGRHEKFPKSGRPK